MKIALIGGGNMGEVIVSAVLSKGISTPHEIQASDISETRRQYLKQKYGIRVSPTNSDAINGADVVIMAIKPQNLAEVLTGLTGKLKPAQLVLSIIAGARIATIRDGLRYSCIVRSMPNTPAQIGEGMTVWTATKEVSDLQKQTARSILGIMGKEIYVEDEKAIDMATAVSGSGPAYFFLFVEALTDAAVATGLPRDKAKEMVLQTMIGAGHLIEKSGKEPAELRKMVTSPGGTTAEAIRVFEEGGFNRLVAKAVEAAYRKARSLGGEPLP
jgi:pyrroline-5-carboxylate reductase